MIRKGAPMEPAPFTVNFVNAGKYRFHLRRWPSESGLTLGTELNDGKPKTLYTAPITTGNVEMILNKSFNKLCFL